MSANDNAWSHLKNGRRQTQQFQQCFHCPKLSFLAVKKLTRGTCGFLLSLELLRMCLDTNTCNERKQSKVSQLLNTLRCFYRDFGGAVVRGSALHLWDRGFVSRCTLMTLKRTMIHEAIFAATSCNASSHIELYVIYKVFSQGNCAWLARFILPTYPISFIFPPFRVCWYAKMLVAWVGKNTWFSFYKS
jgi:hypothetical protein